MSGKIGGIDRAAYRALSRAGTTEGVAPVFEVAARLSRQPSFGSKSYSTDDVPSGTAAATSSVTTSGSAIARPLLTQPTHNMFSAPQPGAKPISVVRAPTRANTGGGIRPTAPPSSTMLAKMARAAASADSHEPVASSASVATNASTTTGTLASAATAQLRTLVPDAAPASALHAPGGSLSSSVASLPRLTRQSTILDVQRPNSTQYIMIRLYDGERCISDVVVSHLGIKSKTLADVPCAEFDKLHARAIAELCEHKN